MAQQTASSALDGFLTQVRSSGLVRRTDSRWLAGVCSGVAARLRVDPVLVRVAFVVLGFFFGAGVIAYLVGWCLLPNAADDTIVLERAVRDTEPVAILLLVALAISVVTPFSNGGRALSGLLLAGIGVVGIWWWATERNPSVLPAGATPGDTSPTASATTSPASAGTSPAASAMTAMSAIPDAGDTPTPTGSTPESTSPSPTPTTSTPLASAATTPLTTSPTQGSTVPTPYQPIAPSYPATPPYQPTSSYQPRVSAPPKPRRERGGWPLFLFSLGATLVVTQILRLLRDAAGWSIRFDVLMLTGVAATLGIILIAAGLRGYRGGIVSVAAIIAAVSLVGTMSTPDFTRENTGGNVRWAPVQISDLQKNYNLSFANGTLDLTGLPAADLAGTTTQLDVSMGNLTVIVPSTTTVTVQPDVTMGNLEWTDATGASHSVSGLNNHPSPIVIGTGASQLTVNADVTMGNLTIERK